MILKKGEKKSKPSFPLQTPQVCISWLCFWMSVCVSVCYQCPCDPQSSACGPTCGVSCWHSDHCQCSRCESERCTKTHAHKYSFTHHHHHHRHHLFLKTYNHFSWNRVTIFILSNWEIFFIRTAASRINSSSGVTGTLSLETVASVESLKCHFSMLWAAWMEFHLSLMYGWWPSEQRIEKWLISSFCCVYSKKAFTVTIFSTCVPYQRYRSSSSATTTLDMINSPIKCRFVVRGSDPDIQRRRECWCVPVMVHPTAHLVSSSCLLQHTSRHTHAHTYIIYNMIC